MKPRILSTARLSFPLATAVAALITAQSAHAGTVTYNNTGTINSTNGWVGGVIPVTTDEALFTGTPPANIFAAALTAMTWGDMIWDTNTTSTIQMNSTSTTTNAFIRLSGGGGSTEASARGGAAGDLIVMGTNASTNTLTVSATNANTGTTTVRFRLDASGNINIVNAGATMVIETSIGEITGGAKTLTKTGAGRLNLGGANTYTGGTTIKAGTLSLDHAKRSSYYEKNRQVFIPEFMLDRMARQQQFIIQSL